MRQKNNKKLAKASFEEFDAFYPQICFQCQQATEKYLKGFLVYHRKTFPKIHNLTQSVKLCSKIDKNFLKFLKDANVLSQYYLISRYPLEYRPASKREAKEDLQKVEKILFIKKKS